MTLELDINYLYYNNSIKKLKCLINIFILKLSLIFNF